MRNLTRENVLAAGAIALVVTVARVAPPARAADVPSHRASLSAAGTAPHDDGTDSGDGGEGDDGGDDDDDGDG